MILALEDNGYACCKTIYDPKSGKTFTLGEGLSGRTERRARRAARREGRQKRKMSRIEGRTVRAENRQASKTQRQATKQEKKQKRKEVGVQKQEKRMIRVKGKQDVIRARAEQKIQNVTQGSYAPTYQPEQVDQIPSYDNIPAAEYAPDTSTYYPQPEYVDTPYDEINYDPYAEPSHDSEYYYEEAQEEEEAPEGESLINPELSAGFITGAIKGIGNLIQKASESKAGQAVSKVSATYRDYQNCKVQVQNLQYQLQRQKNSCLIKMIASGGAGLMLGIILRR